MLAFKDDVSFDAAHEGMSANQRIGVFGIYPLHMRLGCIILAYVFECCGIRKALNRSASKRTKFVFLPF